MAEALKELFETDPQMSVYWLISNLISIFLFSIIYDLICFFSNKKKSRKAVKSNADTNKN